MRDWSYDGERGLLTGVGTVYDFNRKVIADGAVEFAIDDIAMIETDDISKLKSKDKEVMSALTALLAVNLAGATFCAINPKACFGSCPTFYTDPDATIFAARAEGFSSSVLPSLEATDLDPLGVSSRQSTFELTMKNEALETHVVNRIALHAVAKKEGEMVFHDPKDQFYRCAIPYPYSWATIDGEPADDRLHTADGEEYISLTDSADLTVKEEFIVSFEALAEQDYGVVLRFRQSLLSTYLLYTAYSYMGADAGRYLALFEQEGLMANRARKAYQNIDPIILQVWSHHRQRWENFGNLTETGPIAPNAMIVPVSARYIHEGQLRIRLEAVRGMWRFDQVALAPILAKAKADIRTINTIKTVSGQGAELSELSTADEDYLVTYPGDEYRFSFVLPTLPAGMTHQLFLESRGYYLEWIRKEWLESRDPERLRKMIRKDPVVWRELAREYKSLEAGMEEVFWQSTYQKMQ